MCSYGTVQRPYDSDELLLTDEFLRPFREAFLSSAAAGGFGTKASAFPVKFLNIFDPLRDDNNLGRSVSKGIAMDRTQVNFEIYNFQMVLK